MRLKKTLYAAVAMICFALLSSMFAAENPGASKPDKNRLDKNAVGGVYRWGQLNINNITTWMRYDGEGNHSPGGDNGVYYPIGTGNVVYEDGLVFGGKMFLNNTYTTSPSQIVRVGGGSYLSNVGTKAGYVTGTGASANAVDPNAADVRVYRIRRDYFTASDGELAKDAQLFYELTSIAEVSEAQIAAVRQQYEVDWQNWPTAKGAPYLDRNGNGRYDAPPPFTATGVPFSPEDLIPGNYDEPGVAGSDLSTPADQVMFTVYNDLDRSTSVKFEGSDPVGLEIQKTVWAYKRTDALGNVYFTRYRIINKGGVITTAPTKGAFWVDSMYVCQWSDIDLGDAGDDLVGCDTLKSMGYVYNGQAVDGTFIKFGLPPPASGYDFLAGPKIPGTPTDSAIFNLKRIKGWKNLGMTGFSYFSAGTTYQDPAFGDYNVGTGRWWKMLRGYAPTGSITTPDGFYPFPTGVTPNRFPFAGDPTKPSSATNFIDGVPPAAAQGDRRILLNTGPFQLAYQDTQEIYVGFVVGIGADRISSVSVMKAYDDAVQTTFDLGFQVAKPPASPAVVAAAMNEVVTLEWGSDVAKVAATEAKVVYPGGYVFQGYNVWQFPGAGSSASEGKLIATYDVAADGIKLIFDNRFDVAEGRFKDVLVQKGSDNGVKRYFKFDRDYINDVPKLYNGKRYYVAVTAYSYLDSTGFTRALESTPAVLTVTPKAPFGTTLGGGALTAVPQTVAAGATDYTPAISVVNAYALKDINYQLTFKDTAGSLWWYLKDKANNAVIYKSPNLGSNISGDLLDDAKFPILNGLLMEVAGQPGIIRPESTYFRDPTTKVKMTTNLPLQSAGALSGAPSALGLITMGSDGPNYFGHFASNYSPAASKRVGIRFGPGYTQKAYRLRRTGAGSSYVLQTDVIATYAPAGESFVTVPFQVWDLDGNRQLTVAWRDQNANGYWDPDSAATGTEVVFIYNKTYDATGSQFTLPPVADEPTVGAKADIMYLLYTGLSFKKPVGVPPSFATAAELYVRPRFGYNPSLVIDFSTIAPQTDQAQQIASSAKVGVFPNPYYAFNPAETSRFDRFVTFNNLPQNVTIRIFNVGGHLVRTLRKNNTDQFLRWNIANEYSYPVASGMYIAYVDMPDVPATKILKLAIIQEQEIMDTF